MRVNHNSILTRVSRGHNFVVRRGGRHNSQKAYTRKGRQSWKEE